MGKLVDSDAPAIYCRKCSYDLRGQEVFRCPECGREYDPADRRTFRKRPGRKWIRRVVVAAIALLLAISAPFAWLYYDWRREQPAVERMRDLGAEVQFQRMEPWGLAALVPARFDWMLQRVEAVEYGWSGLTDEDLALIGRCRRLRRLEAQNSVVSDAGVRAISELKDLRLLWIRGRGITDVSAERISRLRSLETLLLHDTSLTDAGLARLCELSELALLQVESDALTDAGLKSLKKLSKLRALYLFAAKIGDEGLAHLSILTALDTLAV